MATTRNKWADASGPNSPHTALENGHNGPCAALPQQGTGNRFAPAWTNQRSSSAPAYAEFLHCGSVNLRRRHSPSSGPGQFTSDDKIAALQLDPPLHSRDARAQSAHLSDDGADGQLAVIQAELDADDGGSAAAATALSDGLTPIDGETLMKLLPGIKNGTLHLSPLKKGEVRKVFYGCSKCNNQFEDTRCTTLTGHVCMLRSIRPTCANTASECCWLGVLVCFLCMYTWLPGNVTQVSSHATIPANGAYAAKPSSCTARWWRSLCCP